MFFVDTLPSPLLRRSGDETSPTHSYQCDLPVLWYYFMELGWSLREFSVPPLVMAKHVHEARAN